MLIDMGIDSKVVYEYQGVQILIDDDGNLIDEKGETLVDFYTLSGNYKRLGG